MLKLIVKTKNLSLKTRTETQIVSIFMTQINTEI